jgi:DNA polymerase III subunit gamma/tau
MAETTSAHTATGYRVLARKYRPQTFADLIGQEGLVRTLTNAFTTGRIAQAYMLTGVRGVGKTTTARLIARALNYPSGATIAMPEITEQCEAILESRHIDVIEMDAASNTGVENMREIIDSVRYAPVQARVKVYIIDEVHMLSRNAFNALLKTLEEPPPHVKFIFATTEIRKVPVTILSRCQRFDLKRLEGPLLASHYANICKLEEVEADEDALKMIARAAEGSVRDGLSILDQAIAFGEGRVRAVDVASMLGVADRTRVVALFDHVMSGKVEDALQELATQYHSGGDPQSILQDLAGFLHFVTRMKVAPQSVQLDGMHTSEEKASALGFAEKLTVPIMSRVWQMLLKGQREVAEASRPFEAAEMLLIRLTHAAGLPSGDELLKLARQASPSASGPVALKRDAPSPSSSKAAAHETSGSLAVAATQPLASPGVTAPQTVSLDSLESIVGFLREKRDIKLLNDIERHVRPVSVSAGKMEIALESDAPPSLPGEIMRRLKMWTGMHWTVSVVRDGGAETIASARHLARDQSTKSASLHPSVVAVLAAFPGSKIIEVRGVEELKLTEEADEEHH